MENVKWTLAIIAELLVLLIKSVYYVGESIYYMFASVAEKSLAEDIVLVRVNPVKKVLWLYLHRFYIKKTYVEPKGSLKLILLHQHRRETNFASSNT